MRKHTGKKIMISAIEHDAVTRPSADYSCDTIPVDSRGVVDVESLKKNITDDHVLLSVMYANNEIGTVQPIKEIADIVASIRKDRQKRGIKTPLYLHTDACQAPNYLDIHTARLNIDLMTLNGGKIYGPKQSGVLYVRAGTLVAPLISGGGQEFGVRSGTENIAFAVGFARSLEKAVAKRSNEVKKVQLLSAKLQTELENQYGAVVNGHKKLRLPNNVHVTFPDADNERVLFALDEMGICAAAGSACSASKEEVSSVLKAIGLSDKNAQSSIRFSLGKHTTAEEIDAVVLAMQEAIIA
jgi:cysteine desulfurase